MVFCLDLPELHFHPHAQRLLLEVLAEQAGTNQILIISHSPLFLDFNRIRNIIVLREKDGITSISQVAKKYRNTDPKSKMNRSRLERKLELYKNKEPFFSKMCLVVEGPTEQEF
jgi:predicted ATP-dependent endonuclease of OLD family